MRVSIILAKFYLLYFRARDKDPLPTHTSRTSLFSPFPTFTDPPPNSPPVQWRRPGLWQVRGVAGRLLPGRRAPLRQGICCWLQALGAYIPGPGLGGRIGLHYSTPRPPDMTGGLAVRAGTGLGWVRRCTSRDVT